MSTDGETSNRLSAALDQIFSRSSADPPAEEHEEHEEHDEPYVLPDIVPATEEQSETAPASDAGSSPTLPAREIRPAAPTTPPAAPTPPAAASPTPSSASTPPPHSPSSPAPAVTSWSDHLAAPTTARGGALRAPGRRPRVRRVTRVLRHVDPWSTFKVAILFSLVTYLVALTSGVLLWRVADSTGTLDNVERWFTQFGWETFELDGGEIFHNAWIIGLFGVVAMTGALVLLATVFNLVSDIIGGVRLTVLEEEVVERTISSTRRYVVRHGAAAAGAAGLPAQDWSVDDADDRRPSPASPTESSPDAAPATGTVPTTAVADWSVDDD